MRHSASKSSQSWCTVSTDNKNARIQFNSCKWCSRLVVIRVGVYCLHLWVQYVCICLDYNSLHWRQNGRDGVSNHQPQDCLLSRLFRRRPKKASKHRVTGLCEGNSPKTGELPAQRASNAENVSIWWRHHVRDFGNSHLLKSIVRTSTFDTMTRAIN